MCLPAAKAERVNNGRKRLNRIAESTGGVGGRGHRYSPSYTSTAKSHKPQEDHNNQPEDALRGGMGGNSSHWIPDNGHDPDVGQKYIFLAVRSDDRW